MYFVKGSIVQHLALDIKIILSKMCLAKILLLVLFLTAYISYLIYFVYILRVIKGGELNLRLSLKRFPMIMGANVANVASME